MISALLGTIAPPAGVWSVTVSPLPTVRKLKPFALRRSAAASLLRPTTFGTVLSAPTSSSAV